MTVGEAIEIVHDALRKYLQKKKAVELWFGL